MTRDDIIRMAREAGLHLPYWDDDQDPKTDPPLGWSCVSPIGKPLERFAAIVAAVEREACAKVAESFDPKMQRSNHGLIIANMIREK